jgi:high affinity Mn2+ porin
MIHSLLARRRGGGRRGLAWALSLGAVTTRMMFIPTMAAAQDAAASQEFAFHIQATSVSQYHPAFTSPYRGAQSLDPGSTGRTTNDVTAYIGLRPWAGAEVWINPEIDQGFGLSDTVGVAGFPSGEAYKVGEQTPYLKLPRAFLRQTVDLGGGSQPADADLNALGGPRAANRIVITVGKFSVVDVFDTNRYAHDPRGDFLDWALIDTGTFDYAADAWGFTYGAAAEWYQGPWTLRAGLFDLSKVPNSPALDPSFGQFQSIGELERRYQLAGRPGALRITGFLTRGRMGDLGQALDQARLDGGPPSLAAVRRYASRGGVSLNFEQQISDDLGLFARAGVADGRKEVFEFTDIDDTAAAGVSLNGNRWGRPDDVIGLAGVVNEISSLRRAYLDAGGLGLLIGDGRLPHAGPETIIETNYDWAAMKGLNLTIDYQFIANPAYNEDRGPVSVLGARLHLQY